MDEASLVQAVREARFAEAVLAKTGDSVVTAVLRGAPAVEGWSHYPAGDVLDPATGAQWYYHCHVPPEAGEHGHFHCFLRPEGADGPVHHLIAVGVDGFGRLRRLFTVNHWMVGDAWLPAAATVALLPRFDLQLDRPSYLVNRWLSAVVRLHADRIAALVEARDAVIARHRPADGGDPREDRALEVTSAAAADLDATARALGVTVSA